MVLRRLPRTIRISIRETIQDSRRDSDIRMRGPVNRDARGKATLPPPTRARTKGNLASGHLDGVSIPTNFDDQCFAGISGQPVPVQRNTTFTRFSSWPLHRSVQARQISSIRRDVPCAEIPDFVFRHPRFTRLPHLSLGLGAPLEHYSRVSDLSTGNAQTEDTRFGGRRST